MNIEKERKFLVDSMEDISTIFDNTICITQGYITSDCGKKVTRIRLEKNKALLCIKSAIENSNELRYEFETEIDYNEGFDAIKTIFSDKLCKMRYVKELETCYWHLDLFKDGKLIILEVELKKDCDEYIIPDWVSQEVTDKPEYLNCNLVKRDDIKIKNIS